jgi:outer membrane receptor protein involved in Fe transport
MENVPLWGRERDTISFGADFAYVPADLYITLSGARHGSLWADSDQIAPLAPSVVIDFSIKKGLYTFGDYGKANIKVAVKNVFNEDYQTSFTDEDFLDTQPGRSFYVALEYAY